MLINVLSKGAENKTRPAEGSGRTQTGGLTEGERWMDIHRRTDRGGRERRPHERVELRRTDKVM